MDSRQISGHGVRSVRARRLAIALIVACALGAMSIGSVSAGRGDTVDPAFMTPTLNPSFDWECWRAADRIVCEGTATETWTAIEIAPCSDGGALYSSGTDSRWIRRVSDAEGRAVTSSLRVQAREHVSRSAAMDGILGRGMGQFSVSFEWGVPGDASTRTSILHGADVLVTVPGHGMLLHQVGVISYDANDTLLFARGVHPVVDDADATFEQLFEQACDFLAEP